MCSLLAKRNNKVRILFVYMITALNFLSKLTDSLTLCKIFVSPDITRENLYLLIWMRHSLFCSTI